MDSDVGLLNNPVSLIERHLALSINREQKHGRGYRYCRGRSAGIGAAKTLRDKGVSFVVLEGSHRIGGRGYTERSCAW